MTDCPHLVLSRPPQEDKFFLSRSTFLFQKLCLTFLKTELIILNPILLLFCKFVPGWAPFLRPEDPGSPTWLILRSTHFHLFPLVVVRSKRAGFRPSSGHWSLLQLSLLFTKTSQTCPFWPWRLVKESRYDLARPGETDKPASQ